MPTGLYFRLPWRGRLGGFAIFRSEPLPVRLPLGEHTFERGIAARPRAARYTTPPAQTTRPKTLRRAASAGVSTWRS